MTPDRLKELRKMAGLEQDQLAEMLAYSHNHYHLIERGKRPMPPGFALRAIAKMRKHLKHVDSILRIEEK